MASAKTTYSSCVTHYVSFSSHTHTHKYGELYFFYFPNSRKNVLILIINKIKYFNIFSPILYSFIWPFPLYFHFIFLTFLPNFSVHRFLLFIYNKYNHIVFSESISPKNTVQDQINKPYVGYSFNI